MAPLSPGSAVLPTEAAGGRCPGRRLVAV